MKTPLALVASLLVAAPAHAVYKKTLAAQHAEAERARQSLAGDPLSASPSLPVDESKWDPATEHTLPSKWFVVHIDGETYLTFFPGATAAKDPTYKGSDDTYKLSVPLFKVTGVTAGAPLKSRPRAKVAKVATEASTYRLEIDDSANFRVMSCPTRSTCQPAKPDSPPVGLTSDPSALKGFRSADPDLRLRVSPPVAPAALAAAGAPPAAQTAEDDPALGPWEQIAFDSLGSPAGTASLKTNKDKRVSLLQTLIQYKKDHIAGGPAVDAPFGAAELLFLKKRMGDGAPDLASADRERARWRQAIIKEIDDFAAYDPSKASAYAGSGYLDEAAVAILKGARAPASDLERALAAVHPGDTRKDGAQRAVVAAWLNGNKGDKGSVDAMIKAVLAAKSPDPKLWSRVWDAATSGGHLENALNGKDAKGAALAKLVDRDTLLDAYCAPGMSGAPSGGAAGGNRSLAQLKDEANVSAGAASSGDDDARTTTLDGRTTAVEGLAGECGQRLGAIDQQIAAHTPRVTNNLTLRTQVPPAPGASNTSLDVGQDKFDKTADPTDPKIGDNKQDADKSADSKMGDHIQKGAQIGLPLGLLGLIGGGPFGLVVLGGLGFALGFGVDKLTNKG